MVDRVTTGLYTFDPQGTNPANLVTGERQTLQTPGIDDYYFIIPFAAPFFADSLVLVNDQTNAPYVEGVDYVIGHKFIEAMEATGRLICGSIRFLRRNISGIVRMNYRTVGGQWGFNDNAVLAELSNRQFNPLIRSWGMIAPLPATFPPLPHDQTVDDFVGSAELLGGLDSIADAIEAASEGSTASHTNDHSNPHQVTAAQVGLGSVQNYPVATQVQAETGTANNAYMTPLRVAQAVAIQAITPLTTHKNDLNNPHGVTKTQVGLGNVPNFRVATEAEAVDPSHNDRFMTPYTTALLMQSGGESARLDTMEDLIQDHVNNPNNPHGVTADQVGAYSKEDVDQMLAGFQADDTTRFSGLTEAEWRLSLPTNADVESVAQKVIDEYNEAIAGNSGVNTTIGAPTPKATIGGVYGGLGRYILTLSDDSVFQFPNQVFPTPVLARSDAFSFIANASYYVDGDGYVHYAGSAAIAPPAAYDPATVTPPAIAAVTVAAQATFVYLQLEDDTIIKCVAGGGSTLLMSNVRAMASSVSGPERTIVVDNNGVAHAFGANGFDTAANAVLSSLTDVESVVVGLGEFFVRFTDGRVRGWTHVINAGVTTVTQITLPIAYANDVSRVAGHHNHFLFLKTNGTMLTRGDNTYGQCEIDPTYGPFLTMDAGVNFSVVVGVNGNVLYLGIGDDNSFLPPATF